MAEEVAAGMVPKSDFDSLWEEFESFKSLSVSVESALNAQVEQQESEIKQLRRLLADGQAEVKDARARSCEQQTSDLALHERVHELEQLTEKLKRKNRELEDRCEAAEHSNHTDAFQQRRLEDACHAAEDRAIMAEARIEELEETCATLRGELRKCREMATNDGPQRQQALRVAEIARDDALRDMKLVAERLRSIAAKCAPVSCGST